MAQRTAPRILVQTVSLDDWGLSDVSTVRFGQAALVNTGSQSRLEVRRLQDELPLPPPLSLRGATPEFSGNNLLVADFARSNRTPLGGYFSTFFRSPSGARATVEQTSDGRAALVLRCSNREPGFCGVWIQLYDFDEPPDSRIYLDGRPFTALSFWIRGHRGNEQLLLKLADAEWELKQDAVPIGIVADFVPAGRLDRDWQQAVVSLDSLPVGIRRETLATFVLEVVSAGSTTVDIGPVAFSLTPDSLPALTQPDAVLGPAAVPHKATWIWNTEELLADPGQQSELLAFLQREGFDHVFLQLPGGPDPDAAPGEVAVDAATLRSLVSALNRLDIRVYALDGDPRYALPRFRSGVLATIDHVIRYNSQVQEHERFYGIRHDIEPYVLPGFSGPRHESLLTGLLRITAASAERAHSAGLKYGADIPFWYDAPADYTYEQVTVEFEGVRKPVSEHMIDLVDDVSIMDYRTTAFGADGTVRHVSGEIEYAGEQGKPVFIGLETGALPDEVLLDFRGDPARGLSAGVPHSAFVVLAAAGDSVLVLHVEGQDERDTSTVSVLTRRLGQLGIDPTAVWWWPISRRVEVPAGKITFERSNARQLDLVMQQTANVFQRYPSFAGFAIHHAQSYRVLREKAVRER